MSAHDGSVEPSRGRPLSDGEFRQLITLLRQHVEHGMDQWEMWKLPTVHGEVFIQIRRGPDPGHDAQAYDDLSRFVNDA